MPWEPWRQDDHGVVERPGGVSVRPLRDDERAWLRERLSERWGGEEVIGRGRSWRPAELSALVAVEGGERVGIATFDVAGEEAELVTIDALVPGRGAGRALLDGVAAAAHAAGAERLRVMTTNDNLRALRLYQRAGFRLEALRPGAIAAARRSKPAISLIGEDGIPIRDELDLVLELRNAE